MVFPTPPLPPATAMTGIINVHVYHEFSSEARYQQGVVKLKLNLGAFPRGTRPTRIFDTSLRPQISSRGLEDSEICNQFQLDASRPDCIQILENGHRIA
jgi:hypothetical protein